MPTVNANHTRLYYEVTGHGPAVVFVHGLGSSTRDWEHQVAELSRSYKAVTFDLRGHGRSEKPGGPYSIPLFATDMHGLLDALAIDSVHVVGLSLGGAVAFQFVLDYPTQVKTLTIVNSGPSFGPAELAQREVERRVGIVQQFGMSGMGETLAAHLFPKADQGPLRQIFIERWAENDPAAYIEATRSILNWDVTHRLHSIHCPTLIVSADQDYSPVAFKESYATLIPRAELAVIEDARHATPMERPHELNVVLAQFLERHR